MECQIDLVDIVDVNSKMYQIKYIRYTIINISEYTLNSMQTKQIDSIN